MTTLQNDRIRNVIGVMTGTSIDGMDAALVRIAGSGLAMRAELVRDISRPMGTMSSPLRSAAAQTRVSAGELAWYGHEFGKLHVKVIEELLSEAQLLQESIELMCVHGQTVFHDPPLSWQLVNTATIAQRFGCPVVSDLRQADLAAGGQGAPITPIGDWVLFRSEIKRRAIVNLGGYCNMTILPAGTDEASLKDVHGFDVCACNQVLDAVAREALGAHYDKDDAVASAGNVVAEAAEELRQKLMTQAKNGRSLGTGDETIEWVTKHLRTLTAEDLAASAVWAVAGCIGEALDQHTIDEIYLAGGGARHVLLAKLLDQHCAAPVRLVDELNVPIEAREAVCMAVLGALCADGVPITLPQVTGCPEPAPVAGVWCGLRGANECRFAPDRSEVSQG